MKKTKKLAAIAAISMALMQVASTGFAMQETELNKVTFEAGTISEAGNDTDFLNESGITFPWKVRAGDTAGDKANLVGPYAKGTIYANGSADNSRFMRWCAASKVVGLRVARSNGNLNHTKDFSVSMNLRIPSENGSNLGSFMFTAVPASTTYDWDNYQLVTKYPIFNYNKGSMSVPSGNAVKAFTVEQGVWYDAKIVFSFASKGNPTYSVMMKKHADSDFTVLVEGEKMPESYGSYEDGIKIWTPIAKLNWNEDIDTDNVTVSEITAYDISLEKCENGSLAFADGSSSSVAPSGRATVLVTPDSGYSVQKVTVNGVDCTSMVNDGKLNLTVNNDQKINAEFKKDEPVLPTIVKNNIVTTGTYEINRVPYKQIVVYSELGEQTGYTLGKYGIYISDENGSKLMLEAHGKSTDGKFAVRVTGPAIVNGVYTVQPFAFFAEGDSADTVEYKAAEQEAEVE